MRKFLLRLLLPKKLQRLADTELELTYADLERLRRGLGEHKWALVVLEVNRQKRSAVALADNSNPIEALKSLGMILDGYAALSCALIDRNRAVEARLAYYEAVAIASETIAGKPSGKAPVS